MDSKIPRDSENDYSDEIVKQRQQFLETITGSRLNYTKGYNFDPSDMDGNCEHFFGVAQVPIGVAGPLLVNGEHAQGEFYVPLATIEGTLIASYNRGMRLIRESGGVMTTVCGDAMQRAPAFVFKNSREARDFSNWLRENFAAIKQQAESTTSVGKLVEIEQYVFHNFVNTRFNFTTGDAAGQNMTGRATYVACEWIRQQYPQLRHYMLSSNFETEKKPSSLNSLGGRGRRVTAEITIPKAVLSSLMRATPEQMAYGNQLSLMSSYIAGSTSNAAHPANGLAALYIATGQDAGCIGEAVQSTVYSYVTRDGDLYFSITLPALVMATYGGGTGLPTQRECLELMDCYGQGKAYKLIEIAAATVLAGELSLGAATRRNKESGKNEWVDAHEKLGRNR